MLKTIALKVGSLNFDMIALEFGDIQFWCLRKHNEVRNYSFVSISFSFLLRTDDPRIWADEIKWNYAFISSLVFYCLLLPIGEQKKTSFFFVSKTRVVFSISMRKVWCHFREATTHKSNTITELAFNCRHHWKSFIYDRRGFSDQV